MARCFRNHEDLPPNLHSLTHAPSRAYLSTFVTVRIWHDSRCHPAPSNRVGVTKLNTHELTHKHPLCKWVNTFSCGVEQSWNKKFEAEKQHRLGPPLFLLPQGQQASLQTPALKSTRLNQWQTLFAMTVAPCWRAHIVTLSSWANHQNAKPNSKISVMEWGGGRVEESYWKSRGA